MQQWAGTVIIVHGLWLHGLAMKLMQRRIERQGYATRTYSYPSVRFGLEENAERLRRYCEPLDAEKINFVGHSLGGLIALEAAAFVPQSRRGRLVLMGTPYTGSFSARCVERLPGGRAMLGRCVMQWLGRTPRAIPDGWEVGVIAGTGGMGLGRLFAPKLPRPNDGVVTVEETRVPGMREHLVLPVSHSEMLLSGRVARHVCAFLARGTFDRGAEKRGVN